MNYHLGGDGNLRGYLDGNLGVRELLALSLEYRSPYSIPGWSEYVSRHTGVSCRLAAFFDSGKIFDEDRPPILSESILFNAGVGLRLSRRTVFGRVNLRADFPLYVSKPSVNDEDDEFAFRWLVSFTDSF